MFGVQFHSSSETEIHMDPEAKTMCGGFVSGLKPSQGHRGLLKWAVPQSFPCT